MKSSVTPDLKPPLGANRTANKAEAGAVRIVFSGDTRQIQSVEAGDALRMLETESRLKSAALTQV